MPLYITNECDSRCKICNMRNQNEKLIRSRGNRDKIREQLDILYSIEKISSVCILSGEYIYGKKREDNLDTVIWTIKEALKIGFEQVLINIGSLFDDEIQKLSNEFSGDSRIVLSLFQETYDRECYSKYFGNLCESNPKSNFDQRVSTLDRWVKAGFKKVDMGVLLGLSDSKEDVNALIKHANRLHEMGAVVYLSVPRIRGVKNLPNEISDDEFIKIICKLRKECPWAKIIITTRESVELMKRVIEHIDVISPGTSDVLPYTKNGSIPNNINTSQFFVKSVRERPSDILNQIKEITGNIMYFNK